MSPRRCRDTFYVGDVARCGKGLKGGRGTEGRDTPGSVVHVGSVDFV